MAVQWEDLAGVDQWVIIFGSLLYVSIIFIPEIISLYLAFNRPDDKLSEKNFDQKWYKWKKQYMWHELWFRTHFITVVCLIVVFIFEQMTAWISALVTILAILITISLKYVSRKVENRVPSAEEKAALYQQVAGTLRSATDMHKGMFNAVMSSSDNDTNGIETKMKQEIELYGH